jgi:hypothetical protein
MGGTWDQYIKWNKPVTEIQVPHNVISYVEPKNSSHRNWA